MNKQQKLKMIGYLVLGILVLNLILFAFLIINWMVFWGTIVIGALFVWKGLPILREKIK